MNSSTLDAQTKEYDKIIKMPLLNIALIIMKLGLKNISSIVYRNNNVLYSTKKRAIRLIPYDKLLIGI